MLAKILKLMIERGQTMGIAEKLDVFWAADKISRDEYIVLKEMLENASPQS